ncbi:MAG: hypothetical protein O2857_02675 [Planctomycetota bacterium]|nr:hypothetical protein [Planctomycetota bacterium]
MNPVFSVYVNSLLNKELAGLHKYVKPSMDGRHLFHGAAEPTQQRELT